ncbi:U1 small nuclear ribonucleoprotein C [Triticum urartu]|uniref:U1 small nuclear ribonucleoprotein C n=2 Tax=Triticum TaxID=4564 RepID=M7ZCG2_TRIUA|nr:U1 small nuclear ribonucleoprotein C [Triticum urartu]
MPRYYCDYCDTYLTHDSSSKPGMVLGGMSIWHDYVADFASSSVPSVRKQHNAGYKHKANVRNYYQQFEEQQTQSLIDQRIKEHLGQAAAFQVGAPFNQHLLQYPGNMPRPRLPILPTPMMQHGYPQHQQPGGPFARPPILPVPGAPVCAPLDKLNCLYISCMEDNNLPVGIPTRIQKQKGL